MGKCRNYVRRHDVIFPCICSGCVAASRMGLVFYSKQVSRTNVFCGRVKGRLLAECVSTSRVLQLEFFMVCSLCKSSIYRRSTSPYKLSVFFFYIKHFDKCIWRLVVLNIVSFFVCVFFGREIYHTQGRRLLRR